MNDDLIEKLNKNLSKLKELDGKLLDGDILLFNYKYLEMFVNKYIDVINGNSSYRSNNHRNYILDNINSEIDRLIYATTDSFYKYEVCRRIYFNNIIFFKDLYKNKMNDIDKTLNNAKEILDSRQEKGVKTYGTTLDEANLSDKELLNHAIEEVADLFLYLTKLKSKLK